MVKSLRGGGAVIECSALMKKWTSCLIGAVICVRLKGSERIRNEDTAMRL
jgi:hypothetical protein